MSNVLLHIADRVLNRPLLILPEKLSLIASVLEERIKIDASDLRAALDPVDLGLMTKPEGSRFVGEYRLVEDGDGKTRKSYRQTADGTAIVPVLGSLVNRGSFFDALSGVSSYETFNYRMAQAATDRSVPAVIIDGDTPGGEALGAMTAADTVRKVASVKPVYAVANAMMASAGYAIASGATRVYVSGDGMLGSIGVVWLHTDHSAALHGRGVKPTLIHAGARKVDGNPYEPLTGPVRAELQAEVDRIYDIFVETVAAGRPGLTSQAIRATEARTYIGADAVSVGLADTVGTIEDALREIGSKAPRAQLVPQPTSPETLPGLNLSTAAERPTAEVLQIVRAGVAAGLIEVAERLARQPPAVVSTAAALGIISIAKAEATATVDDRHACGLWLGKLH